MKKNNCNLGLAEHRVETYLVVEQDAPIFVSWPSLLFLSNFLTEGLLHKCFFGGVEVSHTPTPVVALHSALRILRSRAHSVKAGIEEVAAVCLAPQDSDSFSFSIFEILKQVFSWKALGWPLLLFWTGQLCVRLDEESVSDLSPNF